MRNSPRDMFFANRLFLHYLAEESFPFFFEIIICIILYLIKPIWHCFEAVFRCVISFIIARVAKYVANMVNE